jgi:hypothetical protein
MKKALSLLTVALIVTMPAFALAQTGGGLNSGTGAVTSFNTWLFAFIGVCAVSYLTFKCVQLAGEKIQWIDLGYAIGKVAVVGGVPVLAAWAYAVYA